MKKFHCLTSNVTCLVVCLQKSREDYAFFSLSFCSSSGCNNHFNGIFWLVPSGKDLRMLIGKTPSPSSRSAISIGERVGSLISNSTGAPIDTCSALAPTTLALSKRVSFGGPISIVSGSLVLTCSLFATLVAALRGTRPFFRFCGRYYVINLQYHSCCFCS